MFGFVKNMLNAARRDLTRRKKISVVNQVFQFQFGEDENRTIVRGWLHVADYLDVDAEKLRAVDDLQFLSALVPDQDDFVAALTSSLAGKPEAPLAAGASLIELSNMIGQMKGRSD